MDVNIYEILYISLIEAVKVGIFIGFTLGLFVLVFRKRRRMY